MKRSGMRGMIVSVETATLLLFVALAAAIVGKWMMHTANVQAASEKRSIHIVGGEAKLLEYGRAYIRVFIANQGTVPVEVSYIDVYTITGEEARTITSSEEFTLNPGETREAYTVVYGINTDKPLIVRVVYVTPDGEMGETTTVLRVYGSDGDTPFGGGGGGGGIIIR